MARYPGNIRKFPNSIPAQNSASGIWTMNEQIDAQRRGIWPPERDPYFNYTTLLVKGNVPNTTGLNAMNKALAFNSDASTNNFAITPNGDVRSTPFSPYGGGNYSVYFDGTANGYLRADSSADTNLSGDFTIQAWVYPTANGQLYSSEIISRGAASTFNGWHFGLYELTTRPFFGLNYAGTGSSVYTLSSTNIPLNQWTHLAVTRSGNTCRIYINGSLDTTNTGFTGTPTVSGTEYVYVGRASYDTTTRQFTGYISNASIIKGTALSTFNLTQPLAAGTSGQSLLACTANRFIDTNTATTAKTLTVGSGVRVTDNSPFVSTDFTTGAGYFDGNGDYLSCQSSTSFAFDTSSYTIEFWFNPSNTQTGGASDYVFLVDGRATGGGDSPTIVIQNGAIGFQTESSGINITSNLVPHRWYHVAMVRDATNNKLWCFLDGTALVVGGTTYSGSTSAGTIARPFIIGARYSIERYFNGYISDLRILKGTALYTTNFTPPSYLLQPIPNTVLLTLQTRAASQNNGFIDSSPNNFVVTRNGNVSQGTFTPFSPGGWSYYYNGSSSHSVSNNSDFQFGTGDFSVELWLNKTIASTSVFTRVFSIASTYSSSGKGVELERSHPSGTLEVVISGDTSVVNNIVFTSTEAEWTNSWNHVVITRSGNVLKGFWNGVLKGSVSNSTNINGTGGLRLGDAIGGSLPFTGYVSDFKIVKGAVPTLYQTSSTTIGATIFTPPTSPVSLSTGTVFLTAQTNRFFEGTGKTLTNNGTPQVEPFSPFAPTSATHPLVTGGSAYFDGNDYLSIPDSEAWHFGTNDFTIEAWYYPTTTNAQQIIIGQWSGSTGGTGLSWVLMTSNDSNVYLRALASTDGSGVLFDLVSASKLQINSWNHVALVRIGSTFQLYINGAAASSGSTTSSSAIYNSPNILSVGSSSAAAQYVTGYVSGVRVVKGTAVYSGTNYVVPTAPPTAIPNTSLLLNFTGGGIVDATGKNVLETVANAQLVTAQSKRTMGSLSFDGTGDYLIMPDVLTGQFRTGDFTVEYWCRFGTQATNYAPQVGTLSSASPSGTWRFGTFTNLGGLYLAYHNGSSYVDVTFGSTLYNDNTWRHFALTRQGTTVRAFVDGIQVGSNQTVSQDFNSSNKVIVGAELVTPSYFNGYLDDLRVTRGYARYVTGTGGNANLMVFNGTNTLALPTKAFPSA